MIPDSKLAVITAVIDCADDSTLGVILKILNNKKSSRFDISGFAKIHNITYTVADKRLRALMKRGMAKRVARGIYEVAYEPKPNT